MPITQFSVYLLIDGDSSLRWWICLYIVNKKKAEIMFSESILIANSEDLVFKKF